MGQKSGLPRLDKRFLSLCASMPWHVLRIIWGFAGTAESWHSLPYLNCFVRCKMQVSWSCCQRNPLISRLGSHAPKRTLSQCGDPRLFVVGGVVLTAPKGVHGDRESLFLLWYFLVATWHCQVLIYWGHNFCSKTLDSKKRYSCGKKFQVMGLLLGWRRALWVSYKMCNLKLQQIEPSETK